MHKKLFNFLVNKKKLFNLEKKKKKKKKIGAVSKGKIKKKDTVNLIISKKLNVGLSPKKLDSLF